MAQWIRRLPTEQEILGSSPSMGFFFLGDNPDASVAERLRRWIQVPVNFVGVGSIPTGCTFFSLVFASAGQKSCSNRGSNSGPRACEARVITNYTIRAYEAKKKWRSRVSIPVPADCEPTALPSELHPQNTRPHTALVAQWIAHQTSDLGVGGSSPP
jgi:hypothetical protein